MTGFIRFSWGFEIPTRPDLWEQSKTEEEYFATLKKLQTKVKPQTYDDFQIPDQEPGVIPGGI